MGLILWPIWAIRWAIWHAMLRVEIYCCKRLLADAAYRGDRKEIVEYAKKLAQLTTEKMPEQR